jgi:hypothetical protein
MDFFLKKQDEVLDTVITNAIREVNKLMLSSRNKIDYPISTQFLKYQDDKDPEELDFNFMKQTLDDLINKPDVQPKNIPIYKIPIETLDLEVLKSHTESLTQPCIFEFGDSIKISDLDNIRNLLISAPTKTIYDKNTNRYFQSSEFNENNQNIFNQSINKKELMNCFPNLNNYLINGDGFISKKNDFTPLHNSIVITLNTQVEGTKKWVMIDSKDSDYILPIKSPNVINYYSLFSGDNQLYDKFHTKIPRFEATLSKGQFLFVPAWYYHCITTLEDSVSMSLRYAIPIYSYNEFYLPKNVFNHLVEFITNTYMFLNLSSVDTNNDDLKSDNPFLYFIKQNIFPKIIGITKNISKTTDSQFTQTMKKFFDTYSYK